MTTSTTERADPARPTALPDATQRSDPLEDLDRRAESDPAPTTGDEHVPARAWWRRWHDLWLALAVIAALGAAMALSPHGSDHEVLPTATRSPNWPASCRTWEVSQGEGEYAAAAAAIEGAATRLLEAEPRRAVRLSRVLAERAEAFADAVALARQVALTRDLAEDEYALYRVLAWSATALEGSARAADAEQIDTVAYPAFKAAAADVALACAQAETN